MGAADTTGKGHLFAGGRGMPHPKGHVSHSYASCDDTAHGAGVFRVDRIVLEPDRIRRGGTATFRIGAVLNETAVCDVETGSVSMKVTYGGMQVYHEEDSLCDVTARCPLPRDGEGFEIVYVKEFPWITPPGLYEVELRGEVRHEEVVEATLFCVRVGFRVAVW